ncbi:spore germination protein GerW family protein [Sporosarcina sp. JAI121]|uniref:spore germination protein GerW family protein n=1 Tax=Sporosarcina sp. JAI121 TaxID=2723064 RepID=UPI0015C9A377|nr:spore germination protein GerW family protein [Sporosarcina sp. JAI121]NYF25360.1 putative spore protein YtfJ [Sporosarcina sp. JAI121]
MVYGETIEYENKKVLPVAKVNYIVGGGGGFSGETGNSSAAQGEGGGGHISIRPLGVYEINAKKVKFRPIIDFKFALTLFAFLTLSLTLLSKMTRPN